MFSSREGNVPVGSQDAVAAKPLSGDVRLSVSFIFASKRKRDLDNQNKLVFDALTGIVYEDDTQIIDLRLVRRYVARIEVTVW
jgi:Holliday junction resolvase RusA-like endonuclease